MPGRGKSGKPNCGFPLFPPPLEIATSAIPTFPQRRLRLPLSSQQKQKQNRLLALFARSQPSSYDPGKEASRRSMKRRIRGLVSAPPALESKSDFRLISRWNQNPVSGSFLDWKMLIQLALAPLLESMSSPCWRRVTSFKTSGPCRSQIELRLLGSGAAPSARSLEERSSDGVGDPFWPGRRNLRRAQSFRWQESNLNTLVERLGNALEHGERMQFVIGVLQPTDGGFRGANPVG